MFKSNLQQVPGTKVEEINQTEKYSELVLHITNKKLWQENLSLLMNDFGKLIFEEYEGEKFLPTNKGHLSRAEKQLEFTFYEADKIYLLTDKLKVAGLLCVGYLNHSSKNTVIILEIFVSPEYRNQGVSNKLASLLFTDKSIKTALCYTKNPAAVKSIINAATKNNFQSYFGSMCKDNPKIIKFYNKTLNFYKKEGSNSNKPAPTGFMYLKGELNINTPFRPKEAKFDKNNPLQKEFDTILKLQENQKDVAVGILVNTKQ